MKIQVNNNAFSNLLQLASKFGDTCQIKLEENVLSLITASTNGSTVLYVTSPITFTDKLSLNIPSINKLQKLVNCISQPLLDFSFNQNHIAYNDGTLRFKYHVFDDGIISIPKINPLKIKQLSFHTDFSLLYQDITQILKLSTFTGDINKVYLSAENNGILVNFADNQRQNTDSAGYTIKDISINGVLESFALNIDPIRVINSIDCDKTTPIQFKINNELKVLLVNCVVNNVDYTIIISGLANN